MRTSVPWPSSTFLTPFCAVPSQATVSSFLHHAAAALPHLHTLSLNTVHFTLPPPHTFPQLRKVVIRPDKTTHSQLSDELCVSISGYVGQITALTIDILHSEIPWDKILIERTITLTHLIARCDLTDQLLVRFLHLAPCIRCLSVCALRLQSDQHREQVSM